MNDQYLMTGNKLLWHLDRLKDWCKNKRIAPLHIDMGISTTCNISCNYCYTSAISKTNKSEHFDMPLNTIKNFLEDCKLIGIKSITLSGEGENLLNPDFYEAIKYAKKVNLDIGLATNGTLIDENQIDDMIKSLVYLRFNISASTSGSYKKIHGKDFFRKVISNIQKCVEAKKKGGLPVTIGLQMVVTKQNYNDIVPLSIIGKELGVDYLVIKPCSDTPDKTLNVPHKEYISLYDKFEEAESYSNETYSVIIKYNKFENEGKNDYETCYGTAFMIAINGRGDVAPCGHLLNPNQKEEFNMGNIFNTPFRDIVFSERYWKVQEKVQKLNVCRDCETNCKQYQINKFLNIIKHPPQHINFP